MSATTRIEWADATWNPMTGCTHVSEACDHCYAERIAGRNLPVTASHGFTPTFHPNRLDIPLQWRKPRRIFVCSMSDLFHPAFTDEQINLVINVMWLQAPQHTYMVLTKRPERMRDIILEHWSPKRMVCGRMLQPLRNLWLGVTAENQQAVDERIPILLDTPAAVRFVSVEPMLGPVDISPWLSGLEANCGRTDDGSDGPCVLKSGHFGPCYGPGDVASDWTPAHEVPRLDWVILGGETGPGARPMQPEWATDVYQQCQSASVPFFFKQPGSYWGKEVGAAWGPMVTTRELPEVAR